MKTVLHENAVGEFSLSCELKAKYSRFAITISQRSKDSNSCVTKKSKKCEEEREELKERQGALNVNSSN